MPVWEIVIKGKFVTGAIVDGIERAKEICKKLLEDRMAEVGIADEKAHGLFQWIPESVEAERL